MIPQIDNTNNTTSSSQHRTKTSVTLAVREEINQLVARIRSGNLEAYGRIIDLTERTVQLTISSILPDHSSYEDITEEVFIKVYQNLDDYELGTNFIAWIRAYARNAALTERKNWIRRKRMASIEDDEIELPSIDPLKILGTASSELAVMIMELIEDLPDLHRELIQRFYFQQQSTREIATALKRSETSVRVTLHRARSALSKECKIQQAAKAKR